MITLSFKEQIAHVTLARPQKRNALDYEMFKQLDKAIITIKKRKDIRAVILDAQGQDFCSGLDVKGVMAKPRQVLSLLFKWLPGNQNLAQRVTLGWQELNVPVIALIQGRCWGGGMQIALGADFRIATKDASFAIMEARWGLCPDMGASLIIPSLLKADDYQRLALTAQPIEASEALELGLISTLEENPMAAAQQLIADIIERSPDAMAAIKRLTTSAYRQGHRRQLARETWSQVRLLMCKNTRIAVKNASSDKQYDYQHRRSW